MKRLEQIAKTDSIFLFYPYDEDSELQYVDEFKKYCIEVHPYSRKKNRKYALINLLKFPYTVGSRNIAHMKKDIEICIRENQIDLINVEFPHMCVNILKINTCIPIILNEHNIEWQVYQNISKSQRNLIKKLIYSVDAFRLKSYERNVKKHLNFSKVTFVSVDDMKFSIENKLYSKEQSVLIPIGADVRNIAETTVHEGKIIIFVGKMSYGPNIEAVKWFVKSIMPIICNKIPNLCFYIVGKEPTKEVMRLSSDSVVVTGMVESISKYYDIADLVVLPLKNGGGVKVKLLEAISYKKPIVATSIGVEGTEYAYNETIPISDDNVEFAEYCIDMLNGGFYDEMEKAYNIFISKYTWENIGIKYRTQLRDVIECLKEKQ